MSAEVRHTCEICGGNIANEEAHEQNPNPTQHIANLACIIHLQERIEKLEQAVRLRRDELHHLGVHAAQSAQRANPAEEFYNIFTQAADQPDDARTA